jgi:hypothetical protein
LAGVADAIELLGGHPRLHVRGDDLQHLGGQAAGDAHLLDLFRGLELDSHARIIPDIRARPRAADLGLAPRRLPRYNSPAVRARPEVAHAGRHRQIHT